MKSLVVTGTQVQDRRVQKTQNLLREALVQLIREKNYDSIVVKDILDRANVGRSTFYTHFRNKDELLVSGIDHMLRSVPTTASHTKRHDSCLWFSLPILEYHTQHRHGSEDKIGTKGRAILHDHLRSVLARRIADGMKSDVRGSIKLRGIPSALLVHYLASTFILVLNWWLETRSPLSPKQVDEMFRSLVLPTLATE